MAAAPDLYSHLINWWSLGDFAGGGSTLHDSGPGDNDGSWLATAGVYAATSIDYPVFAQDCDHALDFDVVIGEGDDAHYLEVPCPTHRRPLCDLPHEGHITTSWNYEPPACLLPGAYRQGGKDQGWTRSGRAGGYVPYPGGSAWYDPGDFTFVIFCKIDEEVGDKHAPGLPTDFFIPGFGGGEFTFYGCDHDVEPPEPIGDRVTIGGTVYIAVDEGYFLPGYVCPDFNPLGVSSFSLPDDADVPTEGFWVTDSRYMTKYAIYGPGGLPYHTFGLCGDHSGFPFNAGWAFYTQFTPKYEALESLHPPARTWYDLWYKTGHPDCFPFMMRFMCEGGGGGPIDINAGPIETGFWHMFALTVGPDNNLRVWRNNGFGPATVSYAYPASGAGGKFMTSNSGLGFGFYDNQKALSGKDELWQGVLSNALVFDKALSYDEMRFLFHDWCHPSFQLRTRHRAEPATADPGDTTAAHVHLDNVRYRAEPSEEGESGGTGGATQLSNLTFRAEPEEE